MKYLLTILTITAALLLGGCEQDTYEANDLVGKWLVHEIINSSDQRSYYVTIDYYPENSKNLVIKNFMDSAGDEETKNEIFFKSAKVIGTQFILLNEQYDDYLISYSTGLISNNGRQITITYSASLYSEEMHEATFIYQPQLQ